MVDQVGLNETIVKCKILFYQEETRISGDLISKKVEVEVTTEELVLVLDKLINNQSTPPTPQERYRHLYVIMAWGSGVVFLALLLLISVMFKDQTPQQLRTQAAILAIAAAAFAVVITGLMNIRAKVGTQVVIGAAGAFGVLVLFYLVNPAMVE